MESHALDAGRSDAATRTLLRCGILAGPFYLALGLIQGKLRDGFDLARHPLSLLAVGPGGWVQTANFVLTGLLVLAAAVGFARALASGSRTVPWLVGAFGLSMIVAAVFPADPMDGFPPGTPKGPPASISPTGLAHFASAALGLTFLSIACFVAVRAMSRRGAPLLAWLSLLTGLAILLGFFGGMAFRWGVWGIWFAVVAGWAWLAAVSIGLSSAPRN